MDVMPSAGWNASRLVRPRARSWAHQLRSLLRRGLHAATQADGALAAPIHSRGCPVVSQYCEITTAGFSVQNGFERGAVCLAACYDRSSQETDPCLGKKPDGKDNFCKVPCAKLGLQFVDPGTVSVLLWRIKQCRDGDTSKWGHLPSDDEFEHAKASNSEAMGKTVAAMFVDKDGVVAKK